MPRVCTVCQHKDRGEIDAALVRGVSSYELESSYTDLTRSSIERHLTNAHIPARLVNAQEARDIADADKIKAELERVKEDVHRLRDKAEQDGDYRTALTGCDRALKALELQAKLSQIISDAPTVNIVTNPTWVQIRTTILEALEGHPHARLDVLEALEGVRDD